MKIKNVAVIGCGVIGASWVAGFLSKGLNVTAYDPADDAKEQLYKLVETFWSSLESEGLSFDTAISNLKFETDLAQTVKNADFIQENAPERLEIKRELLKIIESSTSINTIIASSSSGLLVSDIQKHAKHPERIVLGHPFNPPHLIPLVEVIGGKLTSNEVVQKTLRFYENIGKKPIHVRAEVVGHVANRLQAALWQEAFYLIENDVVSVADLDTAIAHGPGLRWALLGPFINLHLSGGKGGIEHALKHLGPPIESWWDDLGQTRITPELTEKIIEGVNEELKPYDQEQLFKKRDELLLELLQSKNKVGKFL